MDTSPVAVRLFQTLIVGLVLSACGGHANRFQNKEPKIDSIDEAGSVRVSVVSVAPWSESIDALMPRFKLSADDALKKVVPNTRIVDERRLRASRTEIQAGFSGLVPTDVPGERVTTPGTTEGLDTSGSAGGARTAAGMTPVVALEKADLGGTDPMIQYAAANALSQEVQLLNSAVRNACLAAGLPDEARDAARVTALDAIGPPTRLHLVPLER